MTIVDTHCHAGRNWFEPIKLLLYQMDANGVEKAVLVQHRGSYDNSYLLECARQLPGRLSVVGMVDVGRHDAPDELERWAEQGVTGLRLYAHQRSPGPDPLAIWKRAEELGLTVSCQGEVEEFASEQFAGVVEAAPRLPIVIEHLAGATPETRQTDPLFERALQLARYPNTYIKVPGLGEILPRPRTLRPDFDMGAASPLIDMAYDSFGPRRMMWGSDYPPVSGREGYRNALRGVMDHPALRDPEERAWVMGKTALDVFDFDVIPTGNSLREV